MTHRTAILGFVFFWGCSHAPSWIYELPQRPAYYQGTGSSSSNQYEADQTSLANLASSIQVTVSAITKGGSQSSWFGQAVQDEGTFQVVVSTFTQQELEGAQITRRWHDSRKKEYWSYAEVEKRLVEEKIRKGVALLENLEEPRFIVLPDPHRNPKDRCGQFLYSGLTEQLAAYNLQIVSPQASSETFRWLEDHGIAVSSPDGQDLSLGMADFTIYFGCHSWSPPPAPGDEYIYSTTQAQASLHNSAVDILVAARSAEVTDRDASDTLAALSGSAGRAGRELAQRLFGETIKSWFKTGGESRLYRIVAKRVSLQVLELLENILAEQSSALFRRSYQNQVAFLEVRSQDSVRDLSDHLATGLRKAGIPFSLSSEGRIILLDF